MDHESSRAKMAIDFLTSSQQQADPWLLSHSAVTGSELQAATRVSSPGWTPRTTSFDSSGRALSLPHMKHFDHPTHHHTRWEQAATGADHPHAPASSSPGDHYPPSRTAPRPESRDSFISISSNSLTGGAGMASPSEQGLTEWDADLRRQRRSSWEAYTEGMKFFVMFQRIIRRRKWKKITERFNELFDEKRTESGLNSAYYRIREEWGLQKVLEKGPQQDRYNRYNEDKLKVWEKSKEVSEEFLAKIGYYSTEDGTLPAE